MEHRVNSRIWPLLTAALLVMAPVESSLARLYKWVDEYGNVTYSERRPPDQAVEEVKVRRSPVSSDQAQEKLDSLKDKASGQQKDRETDQAIAKDNQKEAEAFKKNCEIARQNQKVLQNSARVRGTNAEGESYFLDQKEVQAKLEQSNRQIELYCK